MTQPSASVEPLGSADLRIPAKPEWVAVARLAVAAIANRLPFTVEEIEDLKLAIAEACTNAIQQGATDTIEISCEASPAALRVVVRAAGAAQPAESNRRGVASGEGLGVFLIQALMDEVDYNSTEAGTELVMIKRVGA